MRFKRNKAMKVCSLLVIVSLTLISKTSDANNRSKRSNAENFNVLLSIYKMNPLKHSNVYKMFSNRVLLPRPDEHTPDLNYNSNESTKKPNDTNFKMQPIEETLYAQQSVIDRPLYVDNKKETFDPEQLIKTLINESVNKTNSNEAEVLIDRIYHRNMTMNSELISNSFSNSERRNAKIPARNTRLKVFNLNKIGDNEIDFNDADVVLVK